MPPRILETPGSLRLGVPLFEPLFPVAASTNNATLTTEAAKSELEIAEGAGRAYNATAGTSRFDCRNGTYGFLRFAVPADGETATAYVWMYAATGYRTTDSGSGQPFAGTVLVPSLLFSLAITGGTRTISSRLANAETLVWADTITISTNNQIGSGYLAEVGPATPADGVATLTFDRGWAWAIEVEVKRGTAAKVQGYWALQ